MCDFKTIRENEKMYFKPMHNNTTGAKIKIKKINRCNKIHIVVSNVINSNQQFKSSGVLLEIKEELWN
jgi:hypothetical protein